MYCTELCTLYINKDYLFNGTLRTSTIASQGAFWELELGGFTALNRIHVLEPDLQLKLQFLTGVLLDILNPTRLIFCKQNCITEALMLTAVTSLFMARQIVRICFLMWQHFYRT